MRAMLINGFDRKIEKIDLPSEATDFQKEVKRLLRTEEWGIVHRKEWLTVIYDQLMFSKDSFCYKVELVSKFTFFGNMIFVGRNPATQDMEDLDELKIQNSLFVQFMDKDTSDYYLKMYLSTFLTTFN